MPEDKPKTSKAQQKAVHKYSKNHYDRISVYFPKGHREKIQDRAAATGESVNGYIRKAVDDRLNAENQT